MISSLTHLDLMTFALAIVVTIVAGIVKGAVGFAMPLIMISGLSILMDPKLAIAAIIAPTLLSNGLQTFRYGLTDALAALREFWRYLLMICIAISVAAQTVVLIPTNALYLVLGFPVIMLSFIQLVGLNVHIASRQRVWTDWIVGLVTGTLGGLSASWGPPTVLYLLAIKVPKNRQITIQGVIYGVGSIVFLMAHFKSGILNAESAPLSAFLVVPAFVGLWFGYKLQDRMNFVVFRRVTLVVLLLAGFNLIRRGILG